MGLRAQMEMRRNPTVRSHGRATGWLTQLGSALPRRQKRTEPGRLVGTSAPRKALSPHALSMNACISRLNPNHRFLGPGVHLLGLNPLPPPETSQASYAGMQCSRLTPAVTSSLCVPGHVFILLNVTARSKSLGPNRLREQLEALLLPGCSQLGKTGF